MGQFADTNGQAGARFTQLLSKHWSTLCDPNDGTGSFLYSKEGVTQGDLLSLPLCGIGLLLPWSVH
jgi:hypothetical protein